MKTIFTLTLGLGLIAFSAPVHGQNARYDMDHFDQSVEARIGILLPFGGNHKKANTKPQLALSLRGEGPRHHRGAWTISSPEKGQEVRKLKLALTFERTPSLLLNDQLLSFSEDRPLPEGGLNALDTYDKAILGVIGVSLVVIAGSIIVFAED